MIAVLILIALTCSLASSEINIQGVSTGQMKSPDGRLEASTGGGGVLDFQGDFEAVEISEIEIKIDESVCVLLELLFCEIPPSPSGRAQSSTISLYHRGKLVALPISVLHYANLNQIYHFSPPEQLVSFKTSAYGIWTDGILESPDLTLLRVGTDKSTNDTKAYFRVENPTFNPKLKFETGFPTYHWTSLAENLEGEEYHFKTIPAILDLSTHQGSSEGGRSLSLSITDISKGEVTIDDVNCNLTEVEEGSLACTSGKMQDEKKFYKGGAGLVKETWFDQFVDIDFSELGPPHSMTKIASCEFTETAFAKSKTHGLFIAPESGPYVFFSNSELLLSTDESHDNAKRIVKAQSSKIRAYLWEESSMSQPQHLLRGQGYYLEIRHFSGSENTHVSVGVKIPSDGHAKNRTPLVQKVNKSVTAMKFREEFFEFDSSFTVKELENELNNKVPAFESNLIIKEHQDTMIFMLPSFMFDEYLETIQFFNAKSQVLHQPGFDRFWWVIPSAFLRTIHRERQVNVWEGSTLAVCSGNCDFQRIDPPQIHDLAIVEGVLILSGTNLSSIESDITVTVGLADCSVLSLSEKEYRCILSKGVAGRHKPVVHDKQVGYYSITADETVNFELSINSVDSPQGTEALYLEIEGSGFYPHLSDNQSVLIGDQECKIQSSLFTEIHCVTNNLASSIRVTVDDMAVVYEDFYHESLVNIWDVSPKYGSAVFVSEFTIEGMNFDYNTMVFIGDKPCFLDLVTDTTIVCRSTGGEKGEYNLTVRKNGISVLWKDKISLKFEVDLVYPTKGSIYGGTNITVVGKGFSTLENSMKAFIGDTECRIIELIDQSSFVCESSVLPSFYDPNEQHLVSVKGLEHIADCNETFEWAESMTPIVNSIVPNTASIGDVVTLVGDNLSEDISVTFNQVPASLTNKNKTHIELIVPPTYGKYPSIKMFSSERGNGIIKDYFQNEVSIIDIYPQTVSQEGAFITIEATGLSEDNIIFFGTSQCVISDTQGTLIQCKVSANSATTPQVLTIDGVRHCEGICYLIFSESFTPSISGISDNLKIYGNFALLEPEVSLDEYECDVVYYSVNRIECVPNAPPGIYGLTVQFAEIGFSAGSYKHTVPLSVTEISEGDSSYAGTRKYTIQGSGLHEEITLAVCGIPVSYGGANGEFMDFESPPVYTVFSYVFLDEMPITFRDLVKIDVGQGKVLAVDSAKTEYIDTDTVLQGSLDDDLWEDIVEFKNAREWNAHNEVHIYRFFRLTSSSPLTVTGTLMLEESSEELKCDLAVSYGDFEFDLKNAVTYSFESTPILHSVTPEVGPSKGNTFLTFTGENFGTDPIVFIDSVLCEILDISSTKLECLTGEKTEHSQQSIHIHFSDKGLAVTNGLEFYYYDKWNDLDAWNGLPPPSYMEDCYIKSGQTMVLTTSPPELNNVVIDGTLIIDDVPGIHLSVQNLEINGKLLIGKEESPFTNHLTIQVKDKLNLENGVLEAYGNPLMHSWSLLQRTAQANSDTIYLNESVDWKTGDTIIITSTSYDPSETEQRSIDAIDGQKIKLNLPLKYRHVAETRNTVEIRAEVGLLSRNIQIVGGREGFDINMAYRSTVRMGYIEILNAKLVSANLRENSYENYLIGSSVHNSLGGVKFLGNYMLIKENVVFNTTGSAFLIEGLYNQIERNLGVSLANRSAIFSINSSFNQVIGNHAVGSGTYGFIYESSGTFLSNTAHSNLESGFLIKANVMSQNTSAWNNNKSGVSSEGKTVLDYAKLAYNKEYGIEYTPSLSEEATVKNSLIMNSDIGILFPEHGALRLEEVEFNNFEDRHYPIGVPKLSESVHEVSALTFRNSNKKIHWEGTGIIRSVDQTLTGKNDAYLTSNLEHIQSPGCSFIEAYSSIVCDRALRTLKIYGIEPYEQFKGLYMHIGQNKTYEKIPMLNENEWVLPVINGESYYINWGNLTVDWNQLSIEFMAEESTESITLHLKHSDSYFSVSDSIPTAWTSMFNITVDGKEPEKTIKALSSNLPIIHEPTGEYTERRWSDPATWNGNFPKEGDEVMVQPDWKLILDVDTPLLAYLEIDGELELDTTLSVKLNCQKVMVRAGTLTGGSEHSEVLHQILFDELENYGSINLKGTSKVSWTYLDQDVSVGDDSIMVRNTDWAVYDKITIGPSSFNHLESEEASIIAVEILDSGISRLNLDRQLIYNHTRFLLNDQVSLDIEVALLSRNLKVQGNKCITSSFEDANVSRKGQFTIRNAEIKCNLVINDTENCKLENSVLDGLGVKLTDSSVINMTNNVIYRPISTGILVMNARESKFVHNLVISAQTIGITANVDEDVFISKNVVSGYGLVGFDVSGTDFTSNLVHSGNIGLRITDLKTLNDFQVFFSVTGILYESIDQQFVANECVLAENAKGLSLQNAKEDVKITNITIASRSSCEYCETNECSRRVGIDLVNGNTIGKRVDIEHVNIFNFNDECGVKDKVFSAVLDAQQTLPHYISGVELHNTSQESLFDLTDSSGAILIKTDEFLTDGVQEASIVSNNVGNSCSFIKSWNGYICSKEVGLLMIKTQYPCSVYLDVEGYKSSCSDTHWSSVVDSGNFYDIDIGADPTEMTVFLTEPSSIVATLKFPNTQDYEVYIDGELVESLQFSLADPKVVFVDDPHGTNKLTHTSLQVSLSSPETIKIRARDVISLTIEINSALENFYKAENVDLFLGKLADVFGVNAGRFKLTDIREGSSIFEILIAENKMISASDMQEELDAVYARIKELVDSKMLGEMLGVDVLAIEVNEYKVNEESSIKHWIENLELREMMIYSTLALLCVLLVVILMAVLKKYRQKHISFIEWTVQKTEDVSTKYRKQ